MYSANINWKHSILTDHKQGYGEVLSSGCLHGAQDCADDGAAYSDECNHDNEPPDGDGLGDGDPTASLAHTTHFLVTVTSHEDRLMLLLLLLVKPAK